MTTKKTDVQSQMIASYLFAQAFATSRDLRSQAYKDGVMAGVMAQVMSNDVRCQFAAGSAERDAFFAGTTEGNAIGRRYLAGEIAIPADDILPHQVEQQREKMELREFSARRPR